MKTDRSSVDKVKSTLQLMSNTRTQTPSNPPSQSSQFHNQTSIPIPCTIIQFISRNDTPNNSDLQRSCQLSTIPEYGYVSDHVKMYATDPYDHQQKMVELKRRLYPEVQNHAYDFRPYPASQGKDHQLTPFEFENWAGLFNKQTQKKGARIPRRGIDEMLSVPLRKSLFERDMSKNLKLYRERLSEGLKDLKMWYERSENLQDQTGKDNKEKVKLIYQKRYY